MQVIELEMYSPPRQKLHPVIKMQLIVMLNEVKHLISFKYQIPHFILNEHLIRSSGVPRL